MSQARGAVLCVGWVGVGGRERLRGGRCRVYPHGSDRIDALLYTCLSVCLAFWLSVWLLVCLSVCLSVRLSV